MEVWENKDWLYDQHIVKHKTITSIAKECHKRVSIIRNKLLENNIPIWSPNDNYIKISEQDEQEIIRLYNEEKKSTTYIGKLFKIDDTRVARILKKNGYKCRTLSESQFAYLEKEPDPRLFDKDWLYDAHWNQNLSCKELGEILGSDPGVIKKHMNDLGIPTKTNSESKIGLMAGDKHPNWQGGKTPLSLLLREYFNINLAPLAAKRDSYTCQKCGKSHTVLNVHHKKHFADIVNEIISEHLDIDYNSESGKMMMYDIISKDKRFLDLDNLITLCKECHILEHLKRA